jgi:hypothetical protein
MQDDARGATALCDTLRGIRGVTNVQANLSAGGATVYYHACSTARAKVLEMLGRPLSGQARPAVVAGLLAEAVAEHLADATRNPSEDQLVACYNRPTAQGLFSTRGKSLDAGCGTGRSHCRSRPAAMRSMG